MILSKELDPRVHPLGEHLLRLLSKPRRVIKPPQIVVHRRHRLRSRSQFPLQHLQRPQIMLLRQRKLAQPLINHRQIIPQLRRHLHLSRIHRFVVRNRLLIKRNRIRLPLTEIQQGRQIRPQTRQQAQRPLRLQRRLQRLP